MRQHVNIKMPNRLLLHKPQYHKLDGKNNLVVMPLVFTQFICGIISGPMLSLDI